MILSAIVSLFLLLPSATFAFLPNGACSVRDQGRDSMPLKTSRISSQTYNLKRRRIVERAATWRVGFVNYFLRVPQLSCSCPAA